MKIAVFGGTGRLGRHLVPKLQAGGHSVGVLTRSPKNLPDAWVGIDTTEGDVTDPVAVQKTVAGQDLVYCLLGAPKEDTHKTRARGTEVIVKAMRAEGVTRIICVSSLGAGDSLVKLPWYFRWIVRGFLLRRPLEDHDEQEKILEESGLDWTVVRPSYLTDGPAQGFAHGPTETLGKQPLTYKVSRADVSDFLAQHVADAMNVKRAMWISN